MRQMSRKSRWFGDWESARTFAEVAVALAGAGHVNRRAVRVDDAVDDPRHRPHPVAPRHRPRLTRQLRQHGVRHAVALDRLEVHLNAEAGAGGYFVEAADDLDGLREE